MLDFLLSIGFSAILYMLLRILNYVALVREDAKKDNLIDKLIAFVCVVLGIFSLPVTLPMYLIDMLYSNRSQKRMDSRMAEAAFRYYAKCDGCEYRSRANLPFGYDWDEQVWLPQKHPNDDAYM